MINPGFGVVNKKRLTIFARDTLTKSTQFNFFFWTSTQFNLFFHFRGVNYIGVKIPHPKYERDMSNI